MKRLLCIVSIMDAGGAETFLMKLYRNIDREKYQMDFAVSSNQEGIYNKEIESLGGRVFFIGTKLDGAFKNAINLYKLIKREKYDYVLKTSHLSVAAIDLLVAKLAGVKVRVYRSSNSNATSSTTIEKISQKVFSFLPRVFANVKIAPSTEAAEYVFGKGCVRKGKAEILKNGLDLNTYCFNEIGREKIREEFSISDKFVVGHIGRFNKQKNHIFLIKIFKEIKKINTNAVLLLVGEGELKEEIKEQVKKEGIKNSVIFAGKRKDIPQLLSAMDVFVFPSFFEGMPNTVIEAQSTGLSCLISDSVTKEAKICKNVEYISLEQSPQEWAEKALSTNNNDREKGKEKLKEAGYDISKVSNRFIELVFNKNGKEHV